MRKYCDNFISEIAAITYAIDELRNIHDQNIVIFIDSQAAILSLNNLKYNQNCFGSFLQNEAMRSS